MVRSSNACSPAAPSASLREPERSLGRGFARRLLASAVLLLGLADSGLAQDTVRVGLTDAPPLVFVDAAGQPAGFAVELLQEVARAEGWQLAWVEGSWEECMDRLDRGEIDLLFPIQQTVERRRRFAFSKVPISTAVGGLFSIDAARYRVWFDLEGARVATIHGDYFGEAFEQRARAAGIALATQAYADAEEVVQAVTSGVADAAALEYRSGRAAGRGRWTSTELDYAQIEPVFAVSLTGRRDLLDRLDTHLRELQSASGSLYYRLKERWLDDHPSARDTRLLQRIALGLLALLLVFSAFILVSRIQVRRKTRQLRERNLALQQEVEERLRAEARLQESDELSRGILENMPVMMNALGEDGLLAVWNRECERVSGFTAEEMIGNPRALELLYPDPEYREWVKRRAPAGDHVYRDWERLYATKDGEQRVLSTASISKRFPVPGWNAWGIAIDITDRVRAEESALRGERRLRLVTDALPVLIGYLDRECVLRFCNATHAAWFGVPREQLVGRPIAGLLGEAAWPRFQEHARAALQGEERRFELQFGGDGGLKRRWVSVILMPSSEGGQGDEESEIKGFYSLMIDITDSKHAERERELLEVQLRQSQKMEAVGQLASGVAHDFRNLLTVISAHADRVKAEVAEKRSVLASLESMEGAVRQAPSMTRSLLAFSKKLATLKTPIDLCQVVLAAARMLHRTLPASISVHVDVSCRPEPWVHADETQLQQIVLNLAINARDAMPRGGVLELKVLTEKSKRAGSVAKLVVKDSGAGIAPEIVPRIFEPFFTTKGDEHGTGLGLATVHGIVSDHGGKIEVASKLGAGTQFTITLPRIERVEESPNAWDTGPPPAGAGETILLAEDNDQIRQIVAASLIDAGYQVLRTATGAGFEAIFREPRDRIRLLLMDVDLPGRSGLELMRSVRREGSELRVLLISANTDAEVHQEIDRDPRSSILLKPFRMAELVRLVHDLLSSDGEEEDVENGEPRPSSRDDEDDETGRNLDPLDGNGSARS